MMVRWPFLLLMFLLLLVPVLAGDAGALDPSLREAHMTRADYDRVIRIAGADSDPPLPVHNLGDSGRNDLRQAGGAKVLDGAQWHRRSSQERAAILRDLRQAKPDAAFLLLVPKGDLWAVPRAQLAWLGDDLKAFRPWTREEYEALPERLHLQPKLKHQGGKGNKGKSVH